MPCWQFAEVTHVQDSSLQRESILKHSHTRSSLCRCSSHCRTPWQLEFGESQLRGSGSVGLQEDQVKVATGRRSVHKACTHTYAYTCTNTHTHTHTHTNTCMTLLTIRADQAAMVSPCERGWGISLCCAGDENGLAHSGTHIVTGAILYHW